MKRSNRLVLLVGVFLAISAFVGILMLERPQAAPSAIPSQTLPYEAELRLEGTPERWTIVERYGLIAERMTAEEIETDLGSALRQLPMTVRDGNNVVELAPRFIDVPATTLLQRTSWIQFNPTVLRGTRFWYYPAGSAPIRITSPKLAIVTTEPASTEAPTEFGTADERTIVVPDRPLSPGRTGVNIQTTPTGARNDLYYGIATLSGSTLIGGTVAFLWGIVIALFNEEITARLKRLRSRGKESPEPTPPP